MDDGREQVASGALRSGAKKLPATTSLRSAKPASASASAFRAARAVSGRSTTVPRRSGYSVKRATNSVPFRHRRRPRAPAIPNRRPRMMSGSGRLQSARDHAALAHRREELESHIQEILRGPEPVGDADVRAAQDELCRMRLGHPTGPGLALPSLCRSRLQCYRHRGRERRRTHRSRVRQRDDSYRTGGQAGRT